MPVRFLHLRRVFLSLCALSALMAPAPAYAAAGCGEARPPRCINPIFEGETPIYCQPCGNRCISERSICILEPLPGSSSVTEITAEQTKNLGAFFTYLNRGVWNWAFGVGIGAAVFNGVFAGLQIVLSNGDSGKIEAGKNRFLWSTVGLLLLLLAGVILQFINPVGFRNV